MLVLHRRTSFMSGIRHEERFSRMILSRRQHIRIDLIQPRLSKSTMTESAVIVITFVGHRLDKDFKTENIDKTQIRTQQKIFC